MRLSFDRLSQGRLAEAPRRRDWQVGDHLGMEYQIKVIRSGGMGLVYIVDSEKGGRLAAKTFKDEFLWDERIIAAFQREAEAAECERRVAALSDGPQ